MKRVFTQTFGVVGAILEKDGKIALVKEHRDHKAIDAGKWNQPAGWIDVGEDPLKAVTREVEEETGYKFEPTHVLGVYSLVRKDVEIEHGILPHPIKLVFTGDIKNLDAPYDFLAHEIEEVRWFDPQEIYDMDFQTLRDGDIKQEVRDYFEGKRYPLELIRHFEQGHTGA